MSFHIKKPPTHHIINLLEIFILLSIANIPCSHARTIFASTTSNAHADGSLKNPYTINEALKSAEDNQISEIVLLDGVYRFSRPISLSLRRTTKTPLTIKARNRGNVTLSGGILLKNPQTDNLGRYVFNCGSLSESRDLFIANKRAIRARSIEYSYNGSRFSAIPKLKRRDLETPNSSIAIEPEFELLDHTGKVPDIRGWENLEGVEFVFRCAWWEKRCGIKSITGDEIFPIEPAWTSINSIWSNERSSRLNATMPKRTHIEGAIELLDSPGEWYKNGSTVYLIPISQETESEPITLAQLENLITLENSSHISITGINFSHTTWNLPLSTFGFNEGQANVVQQGPKVKMPSAVTVKGSTSITIDSCTFENLGAYGIEIGDASRSTTITNCKFQDIGATAIWVGSTDPLVAMDVKFQCKDISIKNNWIHHSGSVYYGSVGIFVGYASNIEVSSNELCHLPYTGISLGWGWNSLSDRPVEISGNRITKNYVHNHLNEMYDGGAIYTLGTQGGNFENGLLISENLLTHQGVLGNVIYSDGGSSWISIEANTTSNNLSELDLFYEGRGRYVPDWGGCNPVGNLIFRSNTLGNAPNKTPNFRCNPRDPAPWSRNPFIPPNTLISNNIHSSNNPPSKIEEKSKFIHESTKESKGTIAVIFNSPNAKISIKAKTRTTAYISPLIKGRSTEDIRPTYQVMIEPGLNKLSLKSPNNKGEEGWEARISLNDIIHISTESREATIELDGSPQYNLFSYADTTDSTGTIDLLSSNKQLIHSCESWINKPYNWQDLRSIVDLELPMSANARTIRAKVPPGVFTLKSNSDKIFIAITD